MNNLIKIYCDGACSGNPGPGGWGAVLIYKNHIKEINGQENNTTNNRMELTAAIEALKTITKKSYKIEVYTDSTYLCNGVNLWIGKWKSNNWMSKNKPVKNIDLWQKIDALLNTLEISWHWVRGHNGDHYNEIADALARKAIIKNF